MFLSSIGLISVVILSVKFIGWVASFHVYTDIILNGIVNKLQCSIFCVPFEKTYEEGTYLCEKTQF